MNFFKQKAAEQPAVIPTTVTSAAAMFGGQLKPRTISRSESTKPSSLTMMDQRKSVAGRDRSESRERGRMIMERSRTVGSRVDPRGESRDRGITRGGSRERRHQSGDRRRDRSEDRRGTAMTIRRAESRSRREPSMSRREPSMSRREPSADRSKARIDREISIGIDSQLKIILNQIPVVLY